MRYFFVCPDCAARVEYDEDLLDEYMQCTCNKLWQFSEETIMPEWQQELQKAKRKTEHNIEINYAISCPQVPLRTAL